MSESFKSTKEYYYKEKNKQVNKDLIFQFDSFEKFSTPPNYISGSGTTEERKSSQSSITSDLAKMKEETDKLDLIVDEIKKSTDHDLQRYQEIIDGKFASGELNEEDAQKLKDIEKNEREIMKKYDKKNNRGNIFQRLLFFEKKYNVESTTINNNNKNERHNNFLSFSKKFNNKKKLQSTNNNSKEANRLQIGTGKKQSFNSDAAGNLDNEKLINEQLLSEHTITLDPNAIENIFSINKLEDNEGQSTVQNVENTVSTELTESSCIINSSLGKNISDNNTKVTSEGDIVSHLKSDKMTGRDSLPINNNPEHISEVQENQSVEEESIVSENNNNFNNIISNKYKKLTPLTSDTTSKVAATKEIKTPQFFRRRHPNSNNNNKKHHQSHLHSKYWSDFKTNVKESILNIQKSYKRWLNKEFQKDEETPTKETVEICDNPDSKINEGNEEPEPDTQPEPEPEPQSEQISFTDSNTVTEENPVTATLPTSASTQITPLCSPNIEVLG